MMAKYIFAGLSALFLILATAQWMRNGRRVVPQTKAWFLVGTIFAVVTLIVWIGA